MRKLIFAFLLLAFASQAGAQNTAFRWILGETNRIYKAPKFDNYCMGMGLDRSFNDKLTVGFDISYDIGNALRTDPPYTTLTSGGTDASYTMKPGLLAMNYHTEYALGDDGGTHGYIGTFIGLRRIWQNWTLQYEYNSGSGSSGNGSFPSSKKYSDWLIPVGLRMGVRGATDGGFMDLYVALGYQIGGGNKVDIGNLYRANEDFMETTSLALSIGLAYGIGW